MQRSNYTKDQLRLRACKRIAFIMRDMLEETGSSDTRLLGPPLIRDDLVLVGRSSDIAGHREHVIPRLVICNKAHELIESGKTDDEVGEFIAAHLKIVLLTKDECDRLNKSRHFNLRQRMPPGWNFDEDPFERLRVAGISYTLTSG